MYLDDKRVFIGLEVAAPWPEHFPQGRVMAEESRHFTLAFLGSVAYSQLQKDLSEMPVPNWKTGQVGFFERSIFLPQDKPRVVAWYPTFFDDSLLLYQKELADWLASLGYTLDDREFLPHMTIARAPFERRDWKDAFLPLPFYTTDLHVYESLGNSQYKPLWSHTFQPPFVEIEHVADIAFHVYGDTYRNAQMALAFKCPEIKQYLNFTEQKEHVEDIVIALNDSISKMDGEIGSPFKAVSFHGEIREFWEMIVDV